MASVAARQQMDGRAGPGIGRGSIRRRSLPLELHRLQQDALFVRLGLDIHVA